MKLIVRYKSDVYWEDEVSKEEFEAMSTCEKIDYIDKIKAWMDPENIEIDSIDIISYDPVSITKENESTY